MDCVTALAVGGARCVWDDLTAVGAHGWEGPIVACNDIGVTLPRVDHWASLHWDKIEGWAAARKLHHRHDTPTLWTRRAPMGVTVQANVIDEVWGGSSGLTAVQVALMHADRVICCGIPLDERPRFNGSDPWELHEYREGWKRYMHRLKDRVRSASGWTRELLGGPDEWLS